MRNHRLMLVLPTALLVTGGLVFITGCVPSGGGGGGDGDTGGPESVVEDFYAAYAQGDMEKARLFCEVKLPSISEADRARMTATIANIELLGECVDRYIIDWRFVGSPKAADIDDLMDIFIETEITMNRVMVKDGWGNDFVYKANASMGSQDYIIMSYGADGQDGPVPSVAGVVNRPEEDLIWTNGTWLQKPGESQKARYVRLPSLPQGFEYSVDNVDSKGDRAEVTAIITADGQRYEQKVILRNEGGGWYILDIGCLKPFPDELDAKSKDRPGDSQVAEVITNSIGMKLRLIPAGEFMMGAVQGDYHANDNERPQHRVEITKAFYIGVYEVTQAQYEAVMGENPSRFKGSNRPVERVSWNDAVEFCIRLSHKEGATYRLPTEAEWEYACRAGTTTKYYWGDSSAESTVKRYAWYESNAVDGSWTTPHASEEGPQEVGRKLPNDWGLYDMSGNVWEWCEDLLGSYSSFSQCDPKGPSSGHGRVNRGGCWGDNVWCLRSSYRAWSSPDWRLNPIIGFRVVRDCGPPANTKKGKYDEAQNKAADSLGIPVEITNLVGMKLCLIPAGSFKMGAVAGDTDAEIDEKPLHSVKITRPFYIGVYEVTQAQWEAVMGTTLQQQRDQAILDRPIRGEGFRYPIYFVSWNEAKEFCRKLSQKEGVTYRLPTEAEWEYSCRAGSTTKYYWGNSIDSDYAWCMDNNGREAHEVGRTLPNTWGLYDMSGNVWEWCEDWYDEDYYSSSPGQDPKGPSSGKYRVLRGGSWSGNAGHIRSSSRAANMPHNRFTNRGFRIVREVECVAVSPASAGSAIIRRACHFFFVWLA